MYCCDGMLPSVPRLLLGSVFLAGLHFSLCTQNHMTTVFNHNLAKGRKKNCIYGRHRPVWLLVWRLELLRSTGGLSDPLALWVCGSPAFISLHGHHAHFGLAAGMNFVAGNSAMLGVQSWDHNGMEQEKTWLLFSLRCTS